MAGVLTVSSLSQEKKSRHRRHKGVTPGEPTAPLRVLLVSGSTETAADLDRWARSRASITPLVARTRGDALTRAREQQPEVFLVDLLFGGSEGVALGIELLRAAPEAEALFLVANLDLPEVRAAIDMGITRFVVTEGFTEYLTVAVEPLARLAHARRSLRAARETVERLPSWHGEPRGSDLPLVVAEQRYREAFLRASLTKAGSRREAARLVGVPYTTFCVMLRKLGITPPTGDQP